MTLIVPTTRQKRYFAVAKRNAAKSTYVRWKRPNGQGKIAIGAAIVNGNYVIANGCNKSKTHTVQHFHNNSLSYTPHSAKIHAEVDALIYSRFNDLTGCEIFVYRESLEGDLADCKPCKACMNALKLAGVKHLYYTSTKGFHYERI